MMSVITISYHTRLSTLSLDYSMSKHAFIKQRRYQHKITFCEKDLKVKMVTMCTYIDFYAI